MVIEDQQVFTKGEAVCPVHGWLYGVARYEPGRRARDRLMRAARRHAETCDEPIRVSVFKQQTLNMTTDATYETGS